MNCVPDSAATQHMETYDERKLSVPDYRRRICLSSEIFCAGVVISGQFESAYGGFANSWGFLKVGFNRIIRRRRIM